MAKKCIFCGEKPIEKNKEHVIPRWLIELTGDINRTAHFGVDWKSGDFNKVRKFAFKELTFPSCKSCNDFYAPLENCAKQYMLKIMDGEELIAEEYSTILDWFDKVRIGYWLGFLELNKDAFTLIPNFAINSRIGINDRLLKIEKVISSGKRLSIRGTDIIHFYLTPSVFSLIVNNYHFINISYNNIISRRIGFPYPVSTEYTENHKLHRYLMKKGNSRVLHPILKGNQTRGAVTIYQPMFGNGLSWNDPSIYLNNDYVQSHSMDIKSGVGNIFVESPNGNTELSSGDKFIINPIPNSDPEEFDYRKQIEIVRWHLQIRKFAPNSNNLPNNLKELILLENEFIDKIGKQYLDGHIDLLKKYKKRKTGQSYSNQPNTPTP